MHGAVPFDMTRLFQTAPFVGTRGQDFMLAHIHCSLECKRHFFPIHVIGSWNSLPSAVVELQDHGALKAALKVFLVTSLVTIIHDHMK